MIRTLCTSGRCEPVKLAVHGSMLVGASICCLYNLASFWYRREGHNAVNGVVYGMLVALEIAHVSHHLEGI